MSLWLSSSRVSRVLDFALWYRPYVAHKNLYPAMKNEEDEPVQITKNGEKEYLVCPNGIEFFRDGYARPP
eukprot:4056610-Pleurochrysis_carterae.AAC.1